MNMKKSKIIASLMAVSLATSLVGTTPTVFTQAAAKKLQLSVKKCSLQTGKTKIVSANKKVTWKSSNKKVATVKKINGKKAKITAKKKGTCKIIASIGKKKSVIKVTVKKAKPMVTPSTSPEPTTNGAVTATPTPIVDAQTYMSEVSGASITVSVVNTTKGTLVINNNSGADMTFGLNYTIQKYENGQWIVLNANPVAIPAVAQLLQNGKSSTDGLNWASMYGSLSQGTYRVVKDFSIVGQGSVKLASQFEITAATAMGTVSASTAPTGPTATPAVTNNQSVATQSSETQSTASENTKTEPATAAPMATSETGAYPLKTLTPEEKAQMEQAVLGEIPTITVQPNSTQETVEPDSTVYMNETCGVSISISDVKKSNGIIAIVNNSGSNVTFGYDFAIEKYVDGQWTTLTANPVPIPEIAMVIFDGKTHKSNLNWVSMYGCFPSGTYRVVKTLFIGGQGSKKIACQFVIDENTEVGSTSTPATTIPAGEATATPAVVTAAPASTPVVAPAK